MDVTPTTTSYTDGNGNVLFGHFNGVPIYLPYGTKAATIGPVLLTDLPKSDKR